MELLSCPALPKEVPTLIEGLLQLVQLGTGLWCGALVAFDLTTQLVLFLDHRADGSEDVVVAHTGAFLGP